jgi:hypothetical protein
MRAKYNVCARAKTPSGKHPENRAHLEYSIPTRPSSIIAKMRHLEALVLLSAAASSVLGAESSRPRGVGPECELSLLYLNPRTRIVEQLQETDCMLQLLNTTNQMKYSPVFPRLPSSSLFLPSTTTIATALMALTSLAPRPAHSSRPYPRHSQSQG